MRKKQKKQKKKKTQKPTATNAKTAKTTRIHIAKHKKDKKLSWPAVIEFIVETVCSMCIVVETLLLLLFQQQLLLLWHANQMNGGLKWTIINFMIFLLGAFLNTFATAPSVSAASYSSTAFSSTLSLTL